MEKLNKEIIDYYNRNSLSILKMAVVKRFLRRFQDTLNVHQHFGPTSTIEIFGSMGNGTASETSDLDMSIATHLQPSSDKKDKVFLLESLLEPLESSPLKQLGCIDIKPILTANVPIIKCNWIDRIANLQLEIDISIFNPLAVRNTALIRQYCKWDERVAKLAFYLKKFTKEKCIYGANRRFPSSYALSILLIHYLQTVKILPYIQKDFREDFDVPIITEGHDTYFSEQVIENWSSNSSNVAELFLGFLKYYSEFNFDTIVQIHRRKQTTQGRKFWDWGLPIRDPFDHCRNVADMVSKYHAYIIVRVFRAEAKRIERECDGDRALLTSPRKESAPRATRKRRISSDW